jgi:hypothetical protein
MAAKNFGRVNVSVTASTGGLTRGLGNASKQMRGFASQTQGMNGLLTRSLAGFVGLGNGATMAAVGVRALGFAIKTLLGPLLIVTSLVSLFARLGQTASDLDRVGKAARRLGLATETLQAFEGVASEAGVSAERVNVMLTYMTRQVGMLAQGNKATQKAFALLGLSMQDLANLSPEQQFELISQRIMALPTQAERASVAMMLFGRAGAEGLNFIAAAAGGAVTEMQKLQEQLGVSMTTEQVAGIEMMNDALARTSMVFQGFINQFLAQLAPTIATVANLFVKFFAENTSGFSMAQTLAQGLAGAIKLVAGAVTFLYGAFQVLSSFVGVFITGALKAFEGVTWAIQNTIAVMARAAEALPGFDVGLASSLRAAERTMAGLSNAAGQEAAAWGHAAAENFANGVQNMADPFAAFDAEFASVTEQMQAAGAAGGQAFAEQAGDGVSAAIKASTQALKAIVAGTSAGEEFRNSIMRGADPRLEGDKNQERTADATERTADAVEDLAATMGDGLGLAAISV